MEEVWKPLKQNPDYYEISNYGRIRSIGFTNQWGYHKRKQPIELKNHKNNNGYLLVPITINGKRKQASVHRLVASNFLGDIREGFVINHIDGNKCNNIVCNLEICTISYNSKHAYRILKIEHPRQGKIGRLCVRSKPIACLDDDGNIVQTFESARQAAIHFGSGFSYISIAARTGRKSCGYYWKYIN